MANALDAVSLLFQLISMSDAQSPPVNVDRLTQLLISSVKQAATACVCMASLSKRITQLPAEEGNMPFIQESLHTYIKA